MKHDPNKLSKRQKNIIRFMENYMNLNGYPPTIREIGEATDINSTSVVNYNLKKLERSGYIERTARSSRGMRLLKTLDTNGQGQTISVPVEPTSSAVKVPLIGDIVAGEPIEVPESAGHYYDEDDTFEVTATFLNGADPSEVYALRVSGDSMIDAMVRDGDVVLLKHQEVARDGDMVAVWLSERGEITLKYYYNEGDKIRLQPAHPTMEPIYVSAAHCQVQGKVLSVLRLPR